MRCTLGKMPKMKIKNLLIIIFFHLSSLGTFAQKQGNVWYFGDYAGLDFNGGTPTAISNGQITFPPGEGHNEGSSVISDSSGSILFYTDGMTVWNKNHQIMQNGDSLLGNFSSTQSAIIVPSPQDPNRLYYIFTISSGFCCGGNIGDGLRYSKVDMCQDSSLGEILVSEKNIKIMDTVTEKIAVTRHQNGIDYWVLTHKFYSSEFWAFQLTASGIADTVITSIGSVHNGPLAGTQGQLKFSPNGQKIALAASNGLNLLEIFDFDKATGIVSNPMSLYKPNSNNSAIYGVEFSPNNSVLYANGLSSFGPLYAFLAQYDLSSGNLSTINSSMLEIFTTSIGTMGGKGLQLGPDNKIYMVSTAYPSINLSVVNNPNVSGTGCNYQNQIIPLGSGQGSFSLPTFISGYDYSNTSIQCEPIGISNYTNASNYNIFPNPTSADAILMFSNPYNSQHVLKIFNHHGQLLRSISGIYSDKLEIQRNNLPSGLYYFQLWTDNRIVGNGRLIFE